MNKVPYYIDRIRIFEICFFILIFLLKMTTENLKTREL